MPTLILSSDYRWAYPAMRVSVVPPNNRFERSRGSSFDETGGRAMIGIKCLRLRLVKARVAQPHR
jgi:hypothetical protein